MACSYGSYQNSQFSSSKTSSNCLIFTINKDVDLGQGWPEDGHTEAKTQPEIEMIDLNTFNHMKDVVDTFLNIAGFSFVTVWGGWVLYAVKKVVTA